MNLTAIKGLYTILGTKDPEVRGSWVLGSCPFAKFRHSKGTDSNPSFGVTLGDNELSRFHCFSCNSSGDVMDLGIELGMLYKGVDDKPDLPTLMMLCADELDDVGILEGDIPDYETYTAIPEVDYDFPSWWLDKYPSVVDCFSEEPRNYLRARGVKKRVAIELDLRWDDYQRRVMFPYYNQEGLLCGCNGRAIDKSNTLRYYQYPYEKHTNLHLWYRENTMDLDKPLVVTESVFDVASVLRVYSNVIAGFSCSFSKEKALRLGDATEIITLFDAGQGGDIARKNMSKYLGTRVVQQYVPEDDAGVMSIKELQDSIGEVLPLEDYQLHSSA